MFKIFSLPSLFLASLAIGAVLSNAAAADAGCVLCTQVVPQCNCAETQECTIIPQTCQECAHAVCVTPGTSS
ncbi:hypothetical protein MVEN_00492000 [Mycena venus]|uniref:Membrane anchor Opy2 N-terminal domain-containing protein n=1 Tax=Mycena venus TaxID=2733690 RepID=A0A8H6YWL9_9AGAR|nr:hypothetical protein MVEN_00492000 [Mycena venus]